MSTRRLLPILLATVTALVIATMVGPSQAATYPYAPPTSLRADTVANTYAVFSWKAPSSTIDGYSFRYSTSSSMSNPTYRLPSTAVLQINDLKPNTTYYAQVRAKKSGKDVSDWSSRLTFKTTTTAFAPPSAPSFPSDRIRMDSFKMQWGEVPNASRYRVELTGGSLDKAYYFYTHSNENSFYIGRGGDAEDADGRRIYDDAGNVLVAGFPKLQKNTTYSARVRALEAKKENGEVHELTNYSSSRSVSTNAWAVYPPQLFTAESATSAGITLSWQDVAAQAQGAPSDAYRIQYWLDGSSTKYYLNTDKLAGRPQCGSLSGSAPGSGGTVRVTLKALCNLDGAGTVGSAFTAGKKYRFRVAAINNDVAISDYTASAGLDSLASDQPLPTPDDFRVDKVTDTSMTLSWKAVPGATSYRIQQKKTSTSGSTRYLYDICESSGGTAPLVPCTTDGDRRSVTLTRWDDNSTGATSTFKSNEVYYLRIAAQQAPGTGGIQARASDYTTSYLKAQLKGWPYDAPEDVSVKTNDSTSITLQWKSVNDPDGNGVYDPAHPTVRYRIQYSTSETMGSPKYITTSTINATSLKIGGLASEKVYYFRLRAVDQNDVGTLSDYTEIGKPWTARTLGKVGKVNGVLTVEGGCSPADYELVSYWGDDVEDTRQPTSVNGQVASFNADGLLIGSGYNFRYEYTGLGNCVSTWVSNSADKLAESHMLKDYATDYPLALGQNFTLPPTTAFPGVKVAGKVTAGQGGANNPGVWVTAYGGPQDGTSSYREVHDLIMTGADGTYELNGLWPNGKYKFYFRGGGSGMTGGESTYVLWENHVSASNPGTDFNVWLCNNVGGACVPDSNETGDSESSGGSYPGGFGYPVPGNLQRDGAAQTTSLKLKWDPVPNAPMYRVQYSTSETMSGAKYAGFQGTTGTLTGLTAGQKYYVRVGVVEDGAGAGGSKLSDYTPAPYPSFTTLSFGGFSHPTPTSLTSTSATSTSLTLNWADVAGAPFYRVQYSTSSSMSGAKYAGFNASTGTLTGLTPNTKYYFRVAVVEAGGETGGSKLSEYTATPYPSATTSQFAYAVPGNLTSTAQSPTTLTLDWADIAGAPFYRVQYSASSSMSGAKYAGFNASTGILTGLTPGTKYYFRVAVVEAGGATGGGKLSDYTPAPYPSGTTQN